MRLKQWKPKSHANQRKIFLSVHTYNFVLFFVHKIVLRYLLAMHVFSLFLPTNFCFTCVRA